MNKRTCLALASVFTVPVHRHGPAWETVDTFGAKQAAMKCERSDLYLVAPALACLPGQPRTIFAPPPTPKDPVLIQSGFYFYN